MAKTGIAIFPDNPYYWTYDGNPTFLIGGSPTDNLYQYVDDPEMGVEQALDDLLAAGGNYVRHTMQSRMIPGKEDVIIQAFEQTDDGMYDLESWNPAYWDRLETILEWTDERDVVVQLTFWDRFDFADHSNGNWRRYNPWNPANNVTYTSHETGLPAEWDRHPARLIHRFMLSVEDENDALLPHQERYVAKVLEHSLPYDHVLYNVSNETRAPKSWGDHWAEFTHERADESDAGPVYVTQMYDVWDITADMHRRTSDDPETYDYVDVSQNNQLTGEEHYEHLLEVRNRFADRPWPLNNVKCYGADGGPHGDTRDGLERFWQSIFGGCASIRFHRPSSGLGISELAQQHIRAARDVTDRLDLATTEPAPDLVDGNGVRCLRDESTVLVLFVDGGSATLDVKGHLQWYDVAESSWTDGEHREAPLALDAPGEPIAIAAIEAER